MVKSPPCSMNLGMMRWKDEPGKMVRLVKWLLYDLILDNVMRDRFFYYISMRSKQLLKSSRTNWRKNCETTVWSVIPKESCAFRFEVFNSIINNHMLLLRASHPKSHFILMKSVPDSQSPCAYRTLVSISPLAGAQTAEVLGRPWHDVRPQLDHDPAHVTANK